LEDFVGFVIAGKREVKTLAYSSLINKFNRLEVKTDAIGWVKVLIVVDNAVSEGHTKTHQEYNQFTK